MANGEFSKIQFSTGQTIWIAAQLLGLMLAHCNNTSVVNQCISLAYLAYKAFRGVF